MFQTSDPSWCEVEAYLDILISDFLGITFA